MSWIVTWNGKEYDVDPTEFSGLELSLIKQRTGYTFNDLTDGISNFDGDAIRALFWITARRDDQELKFSDFHGPPLKIVLPALPGFVAALEELGKAAGMTETTGSPSSPNGSDGTEDSTTG